MRILFWFEAAIGSSRLFSISLLGAAQAAAKKERTPGGIRPFPPPSAAGPHCRIGLPVSRAPNFLPEGARGLLDDLPYPTPAHPPATLPDRETQAPRHPAPLHDA